MAYEVDFMNVGQYDASGDAIPPRPGKLHQASPRCPRAAGPRTIEAASVSG